MTELKKLKKENYDELINLLNAVFARKNNKETDFEKDLPRMFDRTDESMSNHLGIFENGKLVACVGIYPMPTMIGDEELLFVTVGNVATHWDYTGKGYMNLLMTEAMKELDKMGADVSRLGGLRQRYNRFGYDSCGLAYSFSLTADNNEKCFRLDGDYTFEIISPDDIDAIAFCKSLYDAGGIRIKREANGGYSGFYKSMATWQNTPYIVKDTDGKKIGYISAKGASIGEVFGINDGVTVKIICLWQKKIAQTVSFSIAPYNVELVHVFSAVCESMRIGSPSHFKVMNYEKTAGALLKLKTRYAYLPDGQFVINIEDYGKIKLSVSQGKTECVRTDEKEDLRISRFDAQRFLFGPFPSQCVANVGGVVSAWLPLPLGWNLQDRG